MESDEMMVPGENSLTLDADDDRIPVILHATVNFYHPFFTIHYFPEYTQKNSN
jgi:hypothetical protein